MKITTGNPALDGLIEWLTGGGKLSSPGASIALAFIVQSFIIPILETLATRFRWTLTGPTKNYTVFVASILLVMLVGLVTRSAMTFGDSIAFGIVVATAAMGIHSTKETASKAARAAQDLKQIKVAMPSPEVGP